MPTETATLAAGCFWCTEAIFKRLKGVEKVIPGYSGGDRDNPNYEAVSSGATGHTEAIQLEFDPSIISYAKLLEVFFELHDPTTLNRQGPDTGSQYRSAIFYHNEDQEQVAEKIAAGINKSGKYQNKIVTEISPFKHFYPAEDYHLDYYAKNADAPYCKIVIDPKITKLYKEFKNEVKKEF